MSSCTQIQSTTKKRPSPFEKTGLKEVNKCAFAEAEITFLGEKFKDGDQLSGEPESWIKEDILSRRTVQIHLAQPNDFKFAENGFEYVNLYGPLLDNVRQYATDPRNERYQLHLLKSATRFIVEWAEAQGLKFKAAVPFNLNYRNEDSSVENCARPYSFTHVDFQPIHLQETFKKGENIFKRDMEKIYGQVSKEQYQSLCSRIKTTFNLWIPLNKNRTRNTLSLMDCRSFDPSDLRPYKSDIHSMSIHHKPGQKWVSGEEATIGKALLFNSQLTPHTALELPKREGYVYDPYRQSVEIRFGLVEWTCSTD